MTLTFWNWIVFPLIINYLVGWYLGLLPLLMLIISGFFSSHKNARRNRAIVIFGGSGGLALLGVWEGIRFTRELWTDAALIRSSKESVKP